MKKRVIVLLLVFVIFINLNLIGSIALPDLTVDFSWIPANPTETQHVFLEVVTKNLGATNTTNYTVQVLINGREFTTGGGTGSIYGVIEPGKNRTEAFGLYYANGSSALNPGYSNITVIADYRNETDEADETNNRVTKVIYITPNQIPSCASSWREINTTCKSGDIFISYYNDTNSCNNLTGMPSNITRNCDYDNNGVIGNFTPFNTAGLEVYINNSLGNLSQVYNSSYPVKIEEGGIPIVKFNYDFSTPLNMRLIEIKKQSSSNFGYLIVNNITATKTFTIDRINMSNRVCVKNIYISSIDEISINCTGSNEYLINCPGTNSSFTCNMTNSTFTVSGLTNSAVREQITTTSCTPSWSCNAWSTCINNNQTRVCTDLNNCGTNSGKPSEIQACISCTPNWNCTSWKPEKCPKNETQTRTCTDSNNCGTDAGKLDETQVCEYKGISWVFIIIIIVIILLIIILILLIIYMINRKQSQPVRVSPVTQYGYTSSQ